MYMYMYMKVKAEAMSTPHFLFRNVVLGTFTVCLKSHYFHVHLCKQPLHLSPCSTVVYEMVTMSRAFPNTPGELIIWEVGNNRCQSLQHMHNGKLKDVIQRCWYPDPKMRPSFKELLGTLEQNVRETLLHVYVHIHVCTVIHTLVHTSTCTLLRVSVYFFRCHHVRVD